MVILGQKNTIHRVFFSLNIFIILSISDYRNQNSVDTALGYNCGLKARRNPQMFAKIKVFDRVQGLIKIYESSIITQNSKSRR